MKRFKMLTAVVAPMVIWLPSVACAFSINKIADTRTPIPGGVGDFTEFVSTSGGQFIANGSGGQQGIYSFDLTVTADSHTPAAGFGPGVDFDSFSSVSDGGYNIAFTATTTNGRQVVYVDWLQGLTRKMILVAQSGQSPSTGIIFNSFTNVSSTFPSNKPAEATGEFLSDAGVYSFRVDGMYPSQTVDFMQEATTVPPSSFSKLGQPNFKIGYPFGTLRGDSTIQTMRPTANGSEGIYFGPPNGAGDVPSSFVKLVDTATPSIVNFTGFGDPTGNANDIVFTAHYNDDGKDKQGLFAWGPYTYFPPPGASDPSLQQILASGDIAPDSGGAHFKNFLGITPRGTFLADLDNGTEGIYFLGSANQGGNMVFPGTVADIIDTTDLLDDKAIQSFELPREADLPFGSDSTTAFIVNFTDGSQGLYYFTVPEPAWVGMAVLPLLLIRRKRNL